MSTSQPTRDDKFSFGLWTVGRQARDPFGDPTRPALDPKVQDALAAAGVPELSTPPLATGETYQDLLADRSAFEGFDAEAKGARAVGAVRLAQLAVEHLLGAR